MTLNQPVGIPFQNPDKYTGPDANIVPIKRFPRQPTTTDKKYRIGQVAIVGRSPSTGTEGELWYLARFESNGDATWRQFATGASSPGIDFLLTDDGAPAVGPDGGGVVDVLGGTGIVTSGQDPSTTVTISVDGSVVGQTITGDSGGALSPTAGNWNILGGTGLNTSGAVSTLTINLDGSVVTTQYDGDTGSATPTAGVLNIIGGNGTVTSASGNTVVCEMQSPFVGDFSFESNTGGATETFTVQNTVDQASSAAVVDVQIAGTSSDYPGVRIGVAGTGSYIHALDATTGTTFALYYLDDDNVTPSTATNQIYRVNQVNTVTGASEFLVKSVLTVAEENTGSALIQINCNANAVDTILQFVQLSGTNDAYIHYGMSGNNWRVGCDATDNDLYIVQATVGGWPPSGSNTIVHFEKAQGGSTIFEQTGSITVPRGTTGERPGTPVNGMIRYNTTTAKFEGYEGGAWANLI